MKKKLWYISKYFAPKSEKASGGRGWLLLKELSKSHNYDVLVVTSDSNNLIDVPKLNESIKLEVVDDIKLIWLRTLKYKTAKSFRRILSWLHFEINLFKLDKSTLSKPDIVIVSSLSLLTVLNGLLLKRKYGCKLIFEIRDIWPLTLTEEGGFSKFNPFIFILSLVEWLGYKKSDTIIGTMPNLGQHVTEVLGYNKIVYCIPMGVSDSQVRPKNVLPIAYKRSYLSSSKIKVVHAGTIGITNALDVFFDAALAMRENKNVEFILVGDGPLKKHYEQLYSKLGNVIFAPKVSKNQVHSVLSECDIVYFSVFNSKVWDYGQSLNKVIDYMLSGRPVIASYSGYQTMINEAECGSFVPANNVAALVSEIERYSEMSTADREIYGVRGREWLLKNRKYINLATQLSEILSK